MQLDARCRNLKTRSNRFKTSSTDSQPIMKRLLLWLSKSDINGLIDFQAAAFAALAHDRIPKRRSFVPRVDPLGRVGELRGEPSTIYRQSTSVGFGGSRA